MKKAQKYRRITGMVLCLIIIVLSFFPVVWRKDGALNTIQVFLKHGSELNAVGLILVGVQILVLITYVVFFFCWFCKIDTIWIRVIATFFSVVGVIGAEILAVYCSFLSEVSNDKVQILIMLWPVVRCFLGWIETIMKTSGEEFFTVLLQGKK